VETPVISVVTVTFNSAEYIRGCLDSLARSSAPLAVEHIVVDNGSRDASVEIVTREFPEAIVIRNEENRGFTAANNQGGAVARGRYVVFLNPDTLVPDGTLQTMLEILERHPDIGVLAPRLGWHDRPPSWGPRRTLPATCVSGEDPSTPRWGLRGCAWACVSAVSRITRSTC
jgi:GT2 family glycosyltransferase